MHSFLLRNFIPDNIATKLWGDREKWGLKVIETDLCWQKWLQVSSDFYNSNQREGVGSIVNNAGYKSISDIDLTGKTVLEIGAGDIQHIRYWSGKPSQYFLVDVSPEMLEKSIQCLKKFAVPYQGFLIDRSDKLPFKDNSVDIIVSYFSLEHLYPLLPYLEDFHRVLKPGGFFVGALPAEGGALWGLGRFFTTRRWFKAHTDINPDKIICWEHPNFADKVITKLDQVFNRVGLSFWPGIVSHLDLNLVIKFVYQK